MRFAPYGYPTRTLKIGGGAGCVTSLRRLTEKETVMIAPLDPRWLTNTLSPHRRQILKHSVGKIVGTLGVVSLPFDLIDVSTLVVRIDWNDPTVAAANFLVEMVAISAAPYLSLLASNPRQTLLSLHFWQGER